jgi:hypothetical protein
MVDQAQVVRIISDHARKLERLETLPAGGGGVGPIGGGGWARIADQTVTAHQVTFSAIPSTFRDLVLWFEGRANSSVGINVRFNNDGTALYRSLQVSVDQTGAIAVAGNAALGPDSGLLGQTSIAIAPYPAAVQVLAFVKGYSKTDRFKTYRAHCGLQGFFAAAMRWGGGVYESLVAISRIDIYAGPVAGGATFTGDRFTLFGII